MSLILHLVLGFLLIRNSSQVIEDPVVAVSLDVNQTPVAPRQISKPKAAIEAGAGKIKAEVSASETTSTDSSSDSSPFDSGNVSVKPKVKKSYQIPYPSQAKEDRIEGAVKLSVLINEEGLVTKVNILEGPGHGLNEAAQIALQQFVFSPAEVQGRKVPVQIVYVYRFKLESR